MPQLDAWTRDSTSWLYVEKWIHDHSAWPEITHVMRENGIPVFSRPEDVTHEHLPDVLAAVWSNCRDRKGKWSTLLNAGLVGAAAEGNAGAVEQLVAAGAAITAKDDDGCTALHKASFGGHVDVVALLLGADARNHAVSNPMNRRLWQSKQECLTAPQLVPASSIMRLGTGVDVRDYAGSRALHHAASRGEPHIVRMLLESGADPTARDAHEETPLHHGVFGNNVDSIELIVKAGGDVMARDQAGWTPLHKAAVVGATASVLALVQAGAATEAKGSISGRTPLHEACAYVRPALVSQLLMLGADELAVDNDGLTPSDVVGQRILPGENVRAEEHVRAMLERAPVERNWRRRCLPVMLRWHSSHAAVGSLAILDCRDLDYGNGLQLHKDNSNASASTVAVSEGTEGACEGVLQPSSSPPSHEKLICGDVVTVITAGDLESEYERAPASTTCSAAESSYDIRTAFPKPPPLRNTAVVSEEQGDYNPMMQEPSNEGERRTPGSKKDAIEEGCRVSSGSSGFTLQPSVLSSFGSYEALRLSGNSVDEYQHYQRRREDALRNLVYRVVEMQEDVFREVVMFL